MAVRRLEPWFSWFTVRTSIRQDIMHWVVGLTRLLLWLCEVWMKVLVGRVIIRFCVVWSGPGEASEEIATQLHAHLSRPALPPAWCRSGGGKPTNIDEMKSHSYMHGLLLLHSNLCDCTTVLSRSLPLCASSHLSIDKTFNCCLHFYMTERRVIHRQGKMLGAF